MQLQESGEMYLECILRLSREIGNVRSIDIGEYRGFSKPSISRAMKHLKEGGFINVDENGFITLKKVDIAKEGYKLTVTPADLNSGNTVIEVTNANSLVYTGKALTPEVKVTYNGAELARDTDYEVSYTNNTNAGTATVTVDGKGNYEGTKTVNFNIGYSYPSAM